ncbi:uncharacterized protein EDB91DRAFT_1145723 [Suillus paluster]|uniref:uncharacterized protein n=1 Tax=Suillus paluster TaxID=48578 RepID=UPI001B85ED50|nr:uncharacterized protein EDB91DRAFT_1145723 [Suillus paluster]KAG1734871.1 hypothetical protein EDB91DRAFT_1145723 [Suillus paluster]
MYICISLVQGHLRRIRATAALFLSYLNANIVVLKSRPRTGSTETGVVVLGPNGMHVLQGLGLAESLHHWPSGTQAPWAHMYESSSDLLGKIPRRQRVI